MKYYRSLLSVTRSDVTQRKNDAISPSRRLDVYYKPWRVVTMAITHIFVQLWNNCTHNSQNCTQLCLVQFCLLLVHLHSKLICVITYTNLTRECVTIILQIAFWCIVLKYVKRLANRITALVCQGSLTLICNVILIGQNSGMWFWWKHMYNLTTTVPIVMDVLQHSNKMFARQPLLR